MPITVLETEELNIPKKGITIVDFYAEWCMPCKAMSPILANVAEQDINVIKVNTDKLPKLSAEYNISSIPTMFIYKDGELKEQKTGIIEQNALLQKLKSLE